MRGLPVPELIHLLSSLINLRLWSPLSLPMKKCSTSPYRQARELVETTSNSFVDLGCYYRWRGYRRCWRGSCFPEEEKYSFHSNNESSYWCSFVWFPSKYLAVPAAVSPLLDYLHSIQRRSNLNSISIY